MSPKLEDHPLGEIFPLMRGSEFSALVHDIKENGLREPVVLFEGKILDGRNRYRACQKAGVELQTVDGADIADPLKFVISKNLIRRHLKESQRAYIAAELANTRHGGDRRSQSQDHKTVTQTEAAQLLNVAEKSVRYGVIVKNSGIPEIREAVQAGKVSVSAAAAVAKLPVTEQREIFEKGPRAIISAARKSQNLPGRDGRSEYSILWKCVDEIREALEQSRLDLAGMATAKLSKEINRIVQSRRAT